LFEFELVVYDEVEFFRKHTSDLFDYPYQRRKNKIGSYTFAFNDEDDDGGYTYVKEKLNF